MAMFRRTACLAVLVCVAALGAVVIATDRVGAQSGGGGASSKDKPAVADPAFKLDDNPENVWTKRLWGRWEVDTELHEKLGLEARSNDLVLTFLQDKDFSASALMRIKALWPKIKKGKPETLARMKIMLDRIECTGKLILSTTKGGKVEKATHPFLIGQLDGMPHLLWIRDHKGDYDLESAFLSFLPRANSRNTLFIGGDFMRETFFPYARHEVDEEDAPKEPEAPAGEKPAGEKPAGK